MISHIHVLLKCQRKKVDDLSRYRHIYLDVVSPTQDVPYFAGHRARGPRSHGHTFSADAGV